MKCLYLIIVNVLLLASSIIGCEQGKHLFILSGQSNMAAMDPAISFIPAVNKKFGKDNVIVVKDAHSGEYIRKWYKKWQSADGEKPESTGELYDVLMKKVTAAIEGKKLKTVSFIWMQGEADAKKDGKVYESSLKGLLQQLKDDLNFQDVNFVIGRLSDYKSKKFKHWKLIRQVQVKVADADPRAAWVNTDDLNDGRNKKGKKVRNDLHYSVEGYKILGERFAAKAIELIEKQ